VWKFLSNLLTNAESTKFFIIGISLIVSSSLLVLGGLLRNSDIEISIAGIVLKKKKTNSILNKQLEYAVELSYTMVSESLAIIKSMLGIKEEEDSYKHYRLITIYIAEKMIDILREFFTQNGFIEMSENEFRICANTKIKYMFEESLSISETWYIETIMKIPRSTFIEKCRTPLLDSFTKIMLDIMFEAREIAFIAKNKKRK
jgi:hypothetical protein